MSGWHRKTAGAGARDSCAPADHDGARRLRWALHAYPSAVREAEGDVLIALACDILDAGESSINREALGLLRGGLTMRLGLVALAPWEQALRRAAIMIAGALLAIACGAAAASWQARAYPGEAWAAVLTAPALVVGGQLAGRRGPIACGALLLVSLGVAQSNTQLVPLSWGSIEWNLQGNGWQAGGQGFDLPLLACALPGSLLLLASAAHRRRPVPRSVALATVAWVTAGALGAYLALESTAALNPAGTLRFGDVRLNGLGLCIVAAGFAALAAMAVRFARRRRNPSGMLAAALTVAPNMLVACLYVFSALLLGDVQALLALGTFAITMVVTVLTLARVSSTLAS